jgi:hypothetical protein
VDVSNSEGIRQALYNEINRSIIRFALKYGFPLAGDVGEIEKTASTKMQDPEKVYPIRIIRDDALTSFLSLVDAVRATSTPPTSSLTSTTASSISSSLRTQHSTVQL